MMIYLFKEFESATLSQSLITSKNSLNTSNVYYRLLGKDIIGQITIYKS